MLIAFRQHRLTARGSVSPVHLTPVFGAQLRHAELLKRVQCPVWQPRRPACAPSPPPEPPTVAPTCDLSPLHSTYLLHALLSLSFASHTLAVVSYILSPAHVVVLALRVFTQWNLTNPRRNHPKRSLRFFVALWATQALVAAAAHAVTGSRGTKGPRGTYQRGIILDFVGQGAFTRQSLYPGCGRVRLTDTIATTQLSRRPSCTSSSSTCSSPSASSRPSSLPSPQPFRTTSTPRPEKAHGTTPSFSASTSSRGTRALWTRMRGKGRQMLREALEGGGSGGGAVRAGRRDSVTAGEGTRVSRSRMKAETSKRTSSTHSRTRRVHSA